ncbi:hypothetical protein Tco_1080036 [Tanacetum coccineum]|uniref:Uncharacterized protein n=1 Tax=Tanacetum coccineum TaxID=301880 RepID=A0ABQ5HTJ6_9ASTR
MPEEKEAIGARGGVGARGRESGGEWGSGKSGGDDVEEAVRRRRGDCGQGVRAGRSEEGRAGMERRRGLWEREARTRKEEVREGRVGGGRSGRRKQKRVRVREGGSGIEEAETKRGGGMVRGGDCGEKMRQGGVEEGWGEWVGKAEEGRVRVECEGGEGDGRRRREWRAEMVRVGSGVSEMEITGREDGEGRAGMRGGEDGKKRGEGFLAEGGRGGRGKGEGWGEWNVKWGADDGE